MAMYEPEIAGQLSTVSVLGGLKVAMISLSTSQAVANAQIFPKGMTRVVGVIGGVNGESATATTRMVFGDATWAETTEDNVSLTNNSFGGLLFIFGY